MDHHLPHSEHVTTFGNSLDWKKISCDIQTQSVGTFVIRRISILGQKCNLIHFDWRCVEKCFPGPCVSSC